MEPYQSKNNIRAFKKASLVSVVVPVYNEAKVLHLFHDRLTTSLESSDAEETEILYINDGSSDASLEHLISFARRDASVQVVDLSRNFGKEAAMTAGLDFAGGDAVVIIDADLQDPPELIPEMVKQWRNGFDVVNMKRSSRAGETFLKRKTAALFYTVMATLGPVKMPRDVGDFRLLSRRAVSALQKMPERNRFMKGMFAWIGYPVKEICYNRQGRAAGKTKWNYVRLWALAVEGITSYTIFPLKISGYLGVATAFAAFCYGIFTVVKTIFFGDPVPGYPSLMVAVLFLGGLQLLATGVVGEYLGRIFLETKNRPCYLVNNHYTAVPSSQAAMDPDMAPVNQNKRKGA